MVSLGTGVPPAFCPRKVAGVRLGWEVLTPRVCLDTGDQGGGPLCTQGAQHLGHVVSATGRVDTEEGQAGREAAIRKPHPFTSFHAPHLAGGNPAGTLSPQGQALRPRGPHAAFVLFAAEKARFHPQLSHVQKRGGKESCFTRTWGMPQGGG